MLVRLCEQQAAVGAVLHSRRDLLHLEHSPTEWRLIEDLLEVLQPFKDATTYLSSENYPTLSVLGPLVVQMKKKVEIGISDSENIKSVKRAIAKNLNTRYQDNEIQLMLNKSCFMDPRMKTLPHLSAIEQDHVCHSLVDEMLLLNSTPPSTCISNDHAEDENDTSPPPHKKTALQKILGDSFFCTSNVDGVTVTLHELILSEMSRYKAEPLLQLNEEALKWWREHAPSYPNLSRMAVKYLGIVATSVPSERLFSTAGNIVNVKRSSLDPTNVEKLLFIHDNTSTVNLPYKRITH